MSNKELCLVLAKRMLKDSIWKSANIEGLGTSYADIECILAGIPVKTTWEESTFIVNMNRAWFYLFSNIGNKNDLLFLRNLHEIACKMLVKEAGDLRTGSVRIGGCSYRPPVITNEQAYQGLEMIDVIEDPIDKALVMFCYLTRSQLFLDGNKRVAQLMTNKILIESGVGILDFKIDKIHEFKVLLADYYESNDAFALCEFLRNNCIERVKEGE